MRKLARIMRIALPLTVLASSVVLATATLGGSLGCSSDSTSGDAADAGIRSDASPGDSGPTRDSGGAVDSGVDSGNVADTGAIDGGVDSAVDGSIDGGGDAGPQPINGCDSTAFAANDHTATGDARAITFPTGLNPTQYSIPCMHIKVGQTVKWSGSLPIHPLEPAGGDANSPIVFTGTGTSVSFAFATAGVFGFQCAQHPNIMNGAIQVTP